MVKISHEVKKIGGLSKIIINVSGDDGSPADADLALIVKNPDGSEVMFLPPDASGDKKEHAIYAEGKPAMDFIVNRMESGRYQVVYSPAERGEYEGIVILMDDKAIHDYKFKFDI